MYRIFSYNINSGDLYNCDKLLVLDTDTEEIEIVDCHTVDEYLDYYGNGNTNIITKFGMNTMQVLSLPNITIKDKFAYIIVEDIIACWYDGLGVINDIIDINYAACLAFRGKYGFECTYDEFMKRLCMEVM